MRPAHPYQLGLDRFHGILWLPSALGTNDQGLGPAWLADSNPATTLLAPTATISGVTQFRRNQFTCNANNQAMGPRINNAEGRIVSRSNGGRMGFHFSTMFMLENWVAGSRLFVGLSDAAAGQVVNADLAGQAGQSIGLFRESTDVSNDIFLLTNDGTNKNKFAPNTVRNGGATIATGQAFIFEMWNIPDSTITYCRLASMNFSAPKFDTIVDFWQRSEGPAVNTFLQPSVQLNSVGNTTTKLTVMNVYLTPR